MNRATEPSLHPAMLVAVAATFVALAILIGASARDWIGRPFPGFFVLANRVIPSVGLPGWAGTQDGALYQRALVAVGDVPVADGEGAYRQVGEWPAGATLRYRTQRAASVETAVLRTRAFSRADYWTIFGTYLGTGLLYVMLGLLAAWVVPEMHVRRALLLLGSTSGLYALSAVELYGPGASMRIHVLVEAFLPTTFVYLALVFPRDYGRYVLPIVAVAWWLSLVLAVAYQLLLHQPTAYSTLHAACETYLGVAGLLLTASLIVHHAVAGGSADVRLRSATMGALLGLGVPGVVMLVSGLSGGSLPVNVCTATAFLFPLCFGYGLVREQLGDRVGRRAAVPITG